MINKRSNILPKAHIELLKCHPTTCDISSNNIENSSFKSNDNMEEIIDVSKLLAQLLNAKVVLEKLEKPMVKPSRRFTITRAISSQINVDHDDKENTTHEINHKEYNLYCAKCRKTEIARIKNSTTKICSECKNLMTYLCTKCNVKFYKRYPYLKLHWDRCNGNEKSLDNSLEVDWNESNIEDTNYSDTNISSTFVIDKKLFIVKKIKDVKLMKKYTRYCPKCDKTITNRGQCRTCDRCLHYACIKCNAKYVLKQSMMYHLRSRCYVANEYQCTHCQYNANAWDKMQKHFKRMHTVQPLFKCQLCFYDTKYKHALKIHMIKIHPDKLVEKIDDGNQTDKPNVEDTTSADVHTNSKIVLNENSFTVNQTKDVEYVRYCFKCDEVINTGRYVGRCKTCSNQVGYACKKCNAKYMASQSMFYHLRSQCYPKNDYRCTRCSYTTNNRVLMRKHFSGMHTNQLTLFKCKLCSYDTKYKCNLRKHMQKCDRSKVAKVKFHCKSCNYSTNLHQSLRMHNQIRH